MTLKEEMNQLVDNTKKDMRHLFEKVKQYPLITLLFIIAMLLLIIIPYVQVSLSGITNVTERATQENQDRATLAQIFGGAAIAIGLYYTWRRISISEKELKVTQKNLAITQKNLRVAQDNLKIAQEGQITERFTKAIEQLRAYDIHGNPAFEVRLGGIYALERIANESDKDYWPIMEILTAYIRKNSSVIVIRDKKVTLLAMDIQANESILRKFQEKSGISLDIQAVLTVIGKRRKSFNCGEPNYLNLQATYLQEAKLMTYHLEKADLQKAYLQKAHLYKTQLEEADLRGAYFEEAILWETNLKKAKLWETNFKKAKLWETNFYRADLRGANFNGAELNNANFEEANLEKAEDLTVDQLSKAKTLYKAKLDKDLENKLRAKGFGYLLDEESER